MTDIKEKKNVIKNVSSLFVVQIANYVFPMISIPMVVRIIGPDKFGVINFASAYIAYFVLLIGYGFDLTATRKVAGDPSNADNRNKTFSEVFYSRCILTGISVVLFMISLATLPQLKEEKMVAIFTFITCFATLFTQNWLFQAMQDLQKVAFLNLLSKILFTVAIFILIDQKDDYIWQPLSISIAQLLIAIVSFIWSIKKYNLKFQKTSFKSCLDLLWSEKTFFLSLVTINLYTITNVVVLGIFQNPTQVGFYTAAQKLIGIIQALISIPLAQALFPYISKAFAENYQKGINIAQQLLPIVLYFTAFCTVGILLFSPLALRILYGSEFDNSVIVCQILAFIPMVVGLGTILGIHLMLNLKLDKLFLRITFTGAIVSIFINIFLVSRFGYVGTAFTWLLTELINLSTLYVTLKNRGIEAINLAYFRPSYIINNVKSLRAHH
ncbi:Putative O-antigen transporter [Dyadobacter sp. CECT 9275]|uniref:O-antigen transporter n=1 Tax=Dyadobacter helix TaxID=2822344 RepID=A0A916J9R0_9BACT|nr:flippase [Dyadobacter sp. CECT 9275]CAG4995355.1 Putative O-antigen transporter [Dyadobacter sp. CECT 9275]